MNRCLEISAFAISVLVGIPLAWIAVFGLTRLLVFQRIVEKSPVRVIWLVTLMGVTERAIITALIISAPKLVAGFIGGWVLLKFAGGWSLFKTPTPENRALYSVALFGNVVSIGWAVLVTLYFFPDSLTALSN